MQSRATLASIPALALNSSSLSLLTCVTGAISFPLWVPTLTQQLVSVKGRAHLSQVDALVVPTAVMTTVRAHHP